MQIVIPKRYPALTPYDVIVFLMGPVIGGGDWQANFIVALEEEAIKKWTNTFYKMFMPRLNIVVPCMWGDGHRLAQKFVKVYRTVPDSAPYSFTRSLRWEREFIYPIINGQNNGLLVAGLFPEDGKTPRPKEFGPYARDTYGELAEVTVEAYFNKATNFMIGHHPNFSGAEVRKGNFEFRFGVKATKMHWREVYGEAALAGWVADRLFEMYLLR